MEKGKIKDYLIATKDETISAVVESEALPEVIEGIVESVASEGTAMLLGNVIGALAPRINGIRLNYKQRGFERRVEKALSVMACRIETLEDNFCSLTEEMQEKFRGIYVEWLLDNLYTEKQQEKVPAHVNGFINMMNNDVNDNIMIMFFDTMNQLTQLDIDVLAMYSQNAQENIYGLCGRYNLTIEQVAIIKEKLVRLGLLYSRNDEKRDNNIDEILTYLRAFDKDLKSKKPKGVKFPNIKKPNRSDTYSITSLGRDYLRIISEN